MATYEEALAALLGHINRLESEEKALADCIGQIAAEDVYCEIDLPQTVNVRPDGYAVRAVDIAQASKDKPVTLEIGETVRAGKVPNNEVKPGTAARVMTGSVLPPGADCVVRFEDTDEPPNKCGPNRNHPTHVKIFVTEHAGSNIQPIGSLTSKGSLVLSKGLAIGPSQISVLSVVGRTNVKVIRRPVIAILATGDELVETGQPLAPGMSYNGNMAAVATLVCHYGGIPKVLGIARDTEASIVEKLTEGLAADAIITSGGVSKGDFDLLRVVIEKMGKIVFSCIDMGPGKAVSFGMLEGTGKDVNRRSVPVFALSGPPSGCLINFECLVRPALLKMLGHTALAHPVIEAQATDSYSRKFPMSFVLWTRYETAPDGYQVKLNYGDSASYLSTMAGANSLTVIPMGSVVNPGDKITVWPLDWCL
jgi:molybdopterin molybdotransferase